MPTKKKIPTPRREPEWAYGIPGLTGKMDPEGLAALLDKWEAEHDPEDAAAVLKALREEFAAARR